MSLVHHVYKWDCLYYVWLYADDTVLYIVADSLQIAIKKIEIFMKIKQNKFYSYVVEIKQMNLKVSTSLNAANELFQRSQSPKFCKGLSPLHRQFSRMPVCDKH